jgi:superfamily II DNA/RNA helicase
MEGEKSFDELKLQPKLLRGILEYGFEKPSIVQSKVIPFFVDGKDMIVSAQSGSGKTASYAISILQSIDFDNKEPQAIILVPNGGLAAGVHKVTLFIICLLQ